MSATFMASRQKATTHSRPQSYSFLGHVVGKLVGYKLSRVALGTRMATTLNQETMTIDLRMLTGREEERAL